MTRRSVRTVKEMNMNARIFYCAAALAAGIGLAAPSFVAPAWAEMTKMVGGAPMYPSKNIVENAVNSKDHTTLVAAVKAAGLVDTLEGAGPFTVFAPTNEAFGALPPDTVAMLLKPENKAALAKILTYHVVAGDYTTMKLRALIVAGGGMAELTTVEGGKLEFKSNGTSNIMMKDAKGGWADITISDVMQSNGVIHVIDHVLMPG
jgi:uncharacterized surface protein with fasciclin (FAS1) repeats